MADKPYPPMLGDENADLLGDQLAEMIPYTPIVTCRRFMRGIRDHAGARGIVIEWLRRMGVTIDPVPRDLHEILSRRHTSGEHDLAERHNEHQP